MGKYDSQSDALSKFINVHGDYYDYSNVEYKSSKEHVTVVCPIHGEFSIRPNHHIMGNGCKECAKIKKSKSMIMKLSEIISQFESQHGLKYDYSNVNYINNITKVEIICPTHGSFYQTPKNHKKGQGCPECSKDNRVPYLGNLSKLEREKISPAFIYQAILCHDDERFTKFGVTNNPNRRFGEFGLYRVESFKIKEYGNMEIAYQLEQNIHSELNDSKYKPINKFYGSRECYKVQENILI